ncbi:aspartic proteinase CDR1-like [Neltuma alba]|uniref:aspartic proteinase CDR1-like n=1 Tax=Neltuma alba TaxID=207710 RepID=UPI0010A35042|nr:aspartic proteinase CDR1-like [Prosopis alba]
MGTPLMNITTKILILHVLLLFSSSSSSVKAINGGFSVELIPWRGRPMKLSPSSSSKIAQAPVNGYLGQHLIKISLGTPPKEIFGIADTGSDLIWTQCVPCDGCYKQINPMFNPQTSSTYKAVSCSSSQCLMLDPVSRGCDQKVCNYTYAYADSSETHGFLSQETLILKSTTRGQGGQVMTTLNNVVFGCGHNDKGTFNDHEMGIVGLGRGPLSLISQMGSSFGIKKMFSQCLVPFHTDTRISSKMSFGDGSQVSGNGVVSTPLVSKQDKTPYFVTLNGISVESTFLPFNGNNNAAAAKGNMLLDSGTPPTILPQDFYDRLVSEVRKQVVSLEPIEDDPELGNQLCYRTNTNPNGPKLTAHFEGGDVVLNPIHTFIPPKDGVFCFAMTNTSSDVGIYGNFVQANYLIGFDLEAQVVSFKPMDCTKQ